MKLIPRVVIATVVTPVISLLAVSAMAQGTGSVVESQGFTPGQTPAATSNSSSSNSDALQLLLDQNRQLQAEVQALRGMVEEQGFEIRKLQRDSLSRYTDMDERLRALETSSATAASPATSSSPGLSGTGSTTAPIATAPAGNNSPAVSNPGAGNTSTSSTRPGLNTTTDSATAAGVASTAANSRTANTAANSGNSRRTLQPAVLSEQQLYQMAYDSVINSDFELSIAEFDQYLSIYPAGRFVTNAHYWKGQAYLYLNRFNEAVESYEIILNQYEDSAKLPDAMYGLALAYQGLGNIPQARRLLSDIKRRFPNTGVANLADTRLLTLD